MLSRRIIPILLMKDESLVKTINFKKYNYVGDPINTACIFNELEVDELMVLDISASLLKKEPNFRVLEELAAECFMPLSYGGGIKSIHQARNIFKLGFEKIVINSEVFSNPDLMIELSKEFGSQALIGSIDIKKNIFGRYKVFSFSGFKNTNLDPIKHAKNLTNLGFGEILLTNINREGTWNGFDIDIIKEISDNVSIPVIANGGASSIQDIISALNDGHASAVGLGNLVTYQKEGMGVLINFNEFFHKIN